MIIKENIEHSELAPYELEIFQTSAVNIRIGGHKITVCAAYFPPRNNLKKEHYLDFLRNLGDKFVVGGDFNAKNTYWGSRLTTSKGKELLAAITEIGCNCHSTGKLTY